MYEWYITQKLRTEQGNMRESVEHEKKKIAKKHKILQCANSCLEH